MEKSTGVESRIEVKPSFGLDDSKITQMIIDSMSNAKEDIQARMLKEQQVEAARVIESISAALFDDKNLLNSDEISVIEAAISSLKYIVKTDHADDIEAAIEKLNNSTAIFAERRMDASIRTALSGHSVDEV
jgi:molecular chaperone HscA